MAKVSLKKIYKEDHVISLLKSNFADRSLRVKSKVITMACNALYDLHSLSAHPRPPALFPIIPISMPTSLPLTLWTQSHFPHMVAVFIPQGSCTCYIYSAWNLPLHSHLCFNVTSSSNPSPSTLYKMAPSPSLLYHFHRIYCHLTFIYLYLHLFISSLFVQEHELLESENLALFIVLSLGPKQGLAH